MSNDNLWVEAHLLGWRADKTAGTIDGMTAAGVAFRVLPREDCAILSVRMNPKMSGKLEGKLTANPTFAALKVTAEPDRVLLSFPTADIPAAVLADLLEAAAAWSVELAAASFSDKLETDRESASLYLRGVIGAALGAILGALPWFLAQWFLGWNFWVLGGLVGIASFYGYAFLWGAHSTRFALWSVVICSLLSTAAYVLGAYFLGGEFALMCEFYAAQQITLEPLDIVRLVFADVGGDLLLGWVCCGIGLLGIRGHIQAYTHDRLFLRGRRK